MRYARRMIRGVCFDLDGTIGAYGGEWAGLAADLRTELMLQMCDMNRFGQLLEDAIELEGHLTLRVALEHVLARLELRAPPDLPELAERVLTEYAAEMRPIPGAAALLARLDAAGVRLALVSNGPDDMQKAALRALGFEKYFRAVLVSGDRDVAARKPGARIFGLACTGLQTVPEETLMIGNSLEADVAGALGYGLAPVLFRGEGEVAPLGVVPDGVPVVHDYAELEDVLAARYGL